MALNSTHPEYAEFHEDWVTMRDTYRGERVVKSKGQTYLPATPGQVADGAGKANTTGEVSYQGYKKRAFFPDFVSDAVEMLLGVMWHKPPTFQLPKAMEFLLEKATIKGEGLEQLLRRVNEQQLVTGRVGLLLDMPSEPTLEPRPYIASYLAEDILNWDDGTRDAFSAQRLNFVSLNESEYERQKELTWEFKNKYRILILGDPDRNEGAGQAATYMVGVFNETDGDVLDPSKMTTPTIRGKTLDQIPFVFINSKDILPEPDDPPLIGLAKLALAVYRTEADYRQAIFQLAQDTLVVIGAPAEDDAVRVGAGAQIRLPIGGDAKFIGTNSQGMPEMRQALENDYSRAASKGGQLIDSMSKQKESGDALKIRVASKTATLNQIALAGAGALQELLRALARWMGLNAEEVIITPNLDFAAETLDGDEMVKWMTAKQLGLPLSRRSIHNRLVDRGVTEMSYEDELAEIESEEPIGGTGTEEGGDEDQQQPQDQA